MLLSTVVCSISSGALIANFGYYNFVVTPCMLLFSIGTGLITTFDVNSPMRVWFGYQVLAGLGVGSGFQTGSIVIQTVLPLEWVPVGTACVQLMLSLGGAISIAVAQTIFANGMIDQLTKENLGIDPQIFINSGASELRSILAGMHREDALRTVLSAYMKGLRNTYYISVAMTCCAFLGTLILEIRSVKHKATQVEQKPGSKVDSV